MDGFQRRREQKKKNILEASIALFMEYGIQKVSIAEIAKKANVSQVTIYNYFENKHKLIHEVYIYYVDKAYGEAEQIVYSNLPFQKKIEQLTFNKKDIANQMNEEFYQHIMKEYSTNGYIEKLYVEKGIPLYNYLFTEGREQGYIDQNLSNEAILFYLKMLKDYIQREDVYQTILPMTEDIMKIFFYGIVGKR